jgi:hypothetical protein
MTPEDLHKARRKAVAFLTQAQQPDGSFASQSSPTLTPFEPNRTYRTTFAPALILAALAHVPETTGINAKLADWLLAQKSPVWSFNYWAADAPQKRSLPYPDDLDDTFCALIALYLHDPSITDAACLGHVVKLLIAAEQQPGGPYRTWLVNDKAEAVWKDVDLAVNSNVAYFLRLVAEPLPNLTELMAKAIQSRRFTSPYYPPPYPLLYYMARAYRGPRVLELAEYILSLKHDDWWGSPLNTALALSALKNTGQSKNHEITYAKLLSRQAKDGSWPAEAFCLDPSLKGRTHYSGSPALTTALILEALDTSGLVKSPVQTRRPIGQRAANIYDRILKSAGGELKTLAPALRAPFQLMIDKIKQKGDNQEIILLPYLFYKSLADAAALPDQLFIDLGLANLYGWIAYTIYDDFLDDEGDPHLLSVANAALRYSLRHFELALPDHPDFQTVVRRTFDTIDGANARELAHYRFATDDHTITITKLPSYTRILAIADKSLGHGLTPLAVIAALGVSLSSKKAQLLSRAFSHYLVAKQLSDDLHDWEEDVHQGMITYVTAAILHDVSITPKTYKLNQLLPKMQRRFWHHSVTRVCDEISRQTRLARADCRACGLLKDTNVIAQLTKSIDKMVAETLGEQSKAQKFLKAYKSTTVAGP